MTHITINEGGYALRYDVQKQGKGWRCEIKVLNAAIDDVGATGESSLIAANEAETKMAAAIAEYEVRLAKAETPLQAADRVIAAHDRPPSPAGAASRRAGVTVRVLGGKPTSKERGKSAGWRRQLQRELAAGEDVQQVVVVVKELLERAANLGKRDGAFGNAAMPMSELAQTFAHNCEMLEIPAALSAELRQTYYTTYQQSHQTALARRGAFTYVRDYGNNSAPVALEGRWNAVDWMREHLDLLHPPTDEGREALKGLSIQQLKACWQILERGYDHEDWQEAVFDLLAGRLEEATHAMLRRERMG